MKRYLLSTIKLAIFLGLFCGAHNASALTISPPVKELGADPGSKTQNILKIYNETNSEITVWASTANFTAKESGAGEPEFLDSSGGVSGLASWIKVPTGPITVKPLDWQNIILEIDVPKDAEPGGHYAAVFFSPNKPESEDGKVSVDYKAGSLILLSVSGNVKQEGVLKSFKIKKNQSIFEHLPVAMEIMIENSGNIHFRPGGGVEIKNIFGKKVTDFPIIQTETGGNVLPKSVRKYDVSWGEFEEKNIPKSFWDKVKFEWEHFYLGKYTAETNIGLPQGQSEMMLVSFWLIPWQLILVVILGLLILYLILRTYNRWIIKQARKAK